MNITREGSEILENGSERTKSPNRPSSLFANTVRGACMSGARLKRSRSPQCLPRWARFVFERHGTARYSLRRNGNPYKNTPKAALSAYREVIYHNRTDISSQFCRCNQMCASLHDWDLLRFKPIQIRNVYGLLLHFDNLFFLKLVK